MYRRTNKNLRHFIEVTRDHIHNPTSSSFYKVTNTSKHLFFVQTVVFIPKFNKKDTIIATHHYRRHIVRDASVLTDVGCVILQAKSWICMYLRKSAWKHSSCFFLRFTGYNQGCAKGILNKKCMGCKRQVPKLITVEPL